jgi:hypothetical protein
MLAEVKNCSGNIALKNNYNTSEVIVNNKEQKYINSRSVDDFGIVDFPSCS